MIRKIFICDICGQEPTTPNVFRLTFDSNTKFKLSAPDAVGASEKVICKDCVAQIAEQGLNKGIIA